MGVFCWKSSICPCGSTLHPSTPTLATRKRVWLTDYINKLPCPQASGGNSQGEASVRDQRKKGGRVRSQPCLAPFLCIAEAMSKQWVLAAAAPPTLLSNCCGYSFHWPLQAGGMTVLLLPGFPTSWRHLCKLSLSETLFKIPNLSLSLTFYSELWMPKELVVFSSLPHEHHCWKKATHVGARVDDF
jgi:hypothetical protein